MAAYDGNPPPLIRAPTVDLRRPNIYHPRTVFPTEGIKREEGREEEDGRGGVVGGREASEFPHIKKDVSPLCGILASPTSHRCPPFLSL
ncbi:hypothetical protein MUK42_17815 [Musa troglodytarum]|uniref:Uncharacterized protein n=1 Tax=Musa troglodytarum TaxID=320322 RepID=A0A9E7JIV2_9LILI|nr:hypothetical protein MUK42_17815 [Musa troglodytarum]